MNTDVNVESYCPKCKGVYNRQGLCPQCKGPLRNIELYEEEE